MVYQFKYPSRAIVLSRRKSWNIKAENLVEFAKEHAEEELWEFAGGDEKLCCAIEYEFYLPIPIQHEKREEEEEEEEDEEDGDNEEKKDDEEESEEESEEEWANPKSQTEIVFSIVYMDIDRDTQAHLGYLISGAIAALGFCKVDDIGIWIEGEKLTVNANVSDYVADQIYKISKAFCTKFGLSVESNYQLHEEHEPNIVCVSVYQEKCSTMSFETKEDYECALSIFHCWGRTAFVFATRERIMETIEKIRGNNVYIRAPVREVAL